MQHQQSQSQHPQTAAVALTESTAPEAPPKQVALAMDRLGQAGRLIADIRLGADRLLEALMIAGQSHHQLDKPLHLILKEEASMRQYLQELRSIGTSFSSSFFFPSLLEFKFFTLIRFRVFNVMQLRNEFICFSITNKLVILFNSGTPSVPKWVSYFDFYWITWLYL